MVSKYKANVLYVDNIDTLKVAFNGVERAKLYPNADEILIKAGYYSLGDLDLNLGSYITKISVESVPGSNGYKNHVRIQWTGTGRLFYNGDAGETNIIVSNIHTVGGYGLDFEAGADSYFTLVECRAWGVTGGIAWRNIITDVRCSFIDCATDADSAPGSELEEGFSSFGGIKFFQRAIQFSNFPLRILDKDAGEIFSAVNNSELHTEYELHADSGIETTNIGISDSITVANQITVGGFIRAGTANGVQLAEYGGIVGLQVLNGGDVEIKQALVVLGDLTVEGTTTTINTVNLDVEDAIIVTASNITTESLSGFQSGLKINRGTYPGRTDRAIIWDEDTGTFRVGEYEEGVLDNTVPILTGASAFVGLPKSIPYFDNSGNMITSSNLLFNDVSNSLEISSPGAWVKGIGSTHSFYLGAGSSSPGYTDRWYFGSSVYLNIAGDVILENSNADLIIMANGTLSGFDLITQPAGTVARASIEGFKRWTIHRTGTAWFKGNITVDGSLYITGSHRLYSGSASYLNLNTGLDLAGNLRVSLSNSLYIGTTYRFYLSGSTITSNANFSVGGNTITAGTFSGNANSATIASTVTINSYTSAGAYPLVWHSGTTLYTTSGIFFTPATGKLQVNYLNVVNNVSSSLIPTAAYNLGSAASKWGSLYLSSTLYALTISATTLTANYVTGSLFLKIPYSFQSTQPGTPTASGQLFMTAYNLEPDHGIIRLYMSYYSSVSGGYVWDKIIQQSVAPIG